MAFDTLEQIEDGKSYTKFNNGEKPKARSFIQIDIIPKIMMYIEDLAILSKSLILQRNFYDIISDCSIDIGEMVGKFFETIDSIPDQEIHKIMSYGDADHFNLQGKSAKVFNKHLGSNVKELKRMLRQIGDFGTTHHPLFKRFKHAGMPIFCSGIMTSTGFFAGKFDMSNTVPIGPNPLVDVIPIPYSKQALESYHIIIHALQNILSDIVGNRIICIQRNLTAIIPGQRYDLTALSQDESQLMKKIKNNFYASNPPGKIEIIDTYNADVKKEKILWYVNLLNFLEECKQRMEIQEKYGPEGSAW